jgi:hypothetical protein
MPYERLLIICSRAVARRAATSEQQPSRPSEAAICKSCCNTEPHPFVLSGQPSPRRGHYCYQDHTANAEALRDILWALRFWSGSHNEIQSPKKIQLVELGRCPHWLCQGQIYRACNIGKGPLAEVHIYSHRLLDRLSRLRLQYKGTLRSRGWYTCVLLLGRCQISLWFGPRLQVTLLPHCGNKPDLRVERR